MKAYNHILAATLALASTAAMVSCDDDFDRPPLIIPTATYEANTSIAEFKEMYWNLVQANKFTEVPVNAAGDSIILAGIVTSADNMGNVYQQLELQDESGALHFGINMYDICEKYHRGQEVRINVTGMLVGGYSHLMQVGGLYNGSLGRMEETLFTTHAQVNGLPDVAKADALIVDLTMADLVAHATDKEWLMKYQSMFVRLTDVHFNGGGTLAWSDAPTQTGYTSRQLLDDNGNSLDFRTSNKCKFAADILPAGKGTVVTLLSYYNNNWQLTMMDPSTDCTGFDGTPATPVDPVGDDIFAESFSSGIGAFVIENVTAPAEVPDIWKHDSKYGMVATAYKDNVNYASDAWLISPVIDLTAQTEAYLSYEQALNFFSSADVARTQAQVAIREEGAADWTMLTVPSWPASLSWTFVPTGDIDIKAFAGKKVQIGFRYSSTAQKAGTWELKNVVIRPTAAADTPSGPEAGQPGSQETPYGVSAAKALGNPGTTIWVEGYIVGSAADKTADSFTTATGASASNTNIFIADNPGETDYNKCMPVQLPAGEVREALSLQAKPENLGKKVKLYGDLTAYFGLPGLKNTSRYEF